MFVKSVMKCFMLNYARVFCIMLIGILVNIMSESPSAQDVKSYTIVRADGKIAIDGRLDEKAWDKAAEAVLTETNTGNKVPKKSTVKLLWDDTYLYFAFYCEDPDAWATLTEFDDPIWGEEVVEVFIDPEDREHTYYEIEVSPINNVVDLFVINKGQAQKGRYTGWKDWNMKGFKSGVYVEGDGKKEGTNDTYWTVEMAFPFDEIWTAENRPPQDGDMWRINCYRIERGKSDDRKDDWYAAFNPTKRPSFHTPWQFGKFYFQK